ncbi:MAG: hypothetical protein KJ697_02845 [Nanoarchaeota archaeon]|nr:hypothetical protein [Nanoarchaeota archaeon]MBU4124088.1 hypothetical protein [Nanoarchaeota archaeon]
MFSRNRLDDVRALKIKMEQEENSFPVSGKGFPIVYNGETRQLELYSEK